MTEDDLKKTIADDDAFEERLKQALMIDTPELKVPELPDLDDARSADVVALPARRRPGNVTWFALAASIVAAVLLSMRFADVGEQSLESQLLAHLDHERAALRVTDVRVSDRRLARVVPAGIATMNHDAGPITYAQSCKINGKAVPHLVIQGEKGPVTVLLMPHEMIDSAQSVDGENIHGVILPVGDGSIAIIGEKDEALERIRDNVVNSVSWTS